MNPEFLTIDEIIEIHRNQIKLYGGSIGIRDLKLLESAVCMPQSGFENCYLHKDIYEMAAAYLFHIVQNHPFVDGNKRLGLVSALIFLMNNCVVCKYDNEELYKLTLETANGNKNKNEISEFFREKVKK